MVSQKAKRIVGTAVITIEVGCFIGAYRVWHKMNTNKGNNLGESGNWSNLI